MQWRRIGPYALAVAAFGWIAATAPAVGALTLADLAGGASFSVGPLTFSDFDVTLSGDLSPDAADYPVQLLPNGFRIGGPFDALLGSDGTMLLSYHVAANDPIVVGASLYASTVTIGQGSEAWLAESVQGPGYSILGSLFAYDIEGVGMQPWSAAGFSPVASLDVAKTVHVGSGLFAAIPLIDERFVVLPEPATVWLMALGLGGLVHFGGRRPAAA
jgi:hypothetical protein